MALLRSNEIKIVESDTELETSPDEGEAWRVKLIEVGGLSAGDYVSVYIGRAVVGYFEVSPAGKNHLVPVIDGNTDENIFLTLKKYGKALVYPVAEGETISVQSSSTASVIKITYDVYSAGDVSAEEPNGSKSNELTYLAYLTNTNDFDSSGYYTLDKITNPVEFPNFPVESVPSKATIDVLALGGTALATSVGDGSATLGTSYTTRFRIFYQRKVLFDPDRNGFLFKGNSGYSETGTTQTYDYTQSTNEMPFLEGYDKKIKFLDPVLHFEAGEEVNFQVGATIDSNAPIEANKLNVWTLLKITYTK